jgi:hypothetical protein
MMARPDDGHALIEAAKAGSEREAMLALLLWRKTEAAKQLLASVAGGM